MSAALPPDPSGEAEPPHCSLLGDAAPLSLLVPKLARNHHGGAADLLRPLGLAPGQERLLALLWEREPRSQAELTRGLGVEAPTITKMLTRLERSGFISRGRSETDRRGIDVNLTDNGRALREPVLKVWQELERRLTGDFSAGELKQFDALLQRALHQVTTARSASAPHESRSVQAD